MGATQFCKFELDILRTEILNCARRKKYVVVLRDKLSVIAHDVYQRGKCDRFQRAGMRVLIAMSTFMRASAHVLLLCAGILDR